MKKSPVRSRWKKAQQYEEQWWASRIDRIDLLKLKILKTERAGYWKSWSRLVTSKNLKSLVKAFTFAAPDTTVYILEFSSSQKKEQ